jgi:hypothetical protein
VRAGKESLFSRLSRGVLDLVFPPRCVSCGDMGMFVCDLCSARDDEGGGAALPHLLGRGRG